MQCVTVNATDGANCKEQLVPNFNSAIVQTLLCILSAPTKDFLAQLHIAPTDQVQCATQSQLESERSNRKEILLWPKKKFSKVSRKKSF